MAVRPNNKAALGGVVVPSVAWAYQFLANLAITEMAKKEIDSLMQDRSSGNAAPNGTLLQGILITLLTIAGTMKKGVNLFKARTKENEGRYGKARSTNVHKRDVSSMA